MEAGLGYAWCCMKLNRRGFFGLLAGVAAAPALPALAVSAVQAVPAAVPAPQAGFFIASEVISSALRLLGVLTPGEIARDSEIDAAMFHLHGLLIERLWVSQSQLALELAARLAPQYWPAEFWRAGVVALRAERAA